MKGLLKGWNDFFFRPADPTPLGAMRMVAGALAFWNLWVYGTELEALLGPSGWVDAETALKMRPPGSLAWSLWQGLSEGQLVPVFVGCLVVLGAFTLGIASPVTAVLAWAIVASTARRAPGLNFGFDQILSLLMFYLALTGASGQAVSLDRWLGRWWSLRKLARARRDKAGPIAWPKSGAPRPSVAANLALRLAQIHLAVIYGTAGLAKLQGGMWWDGSAVWPTWVDREFAVMDLSWLAPFPLLVNFATHLTIAVEVSYPFLIWDRRWRPVLLVVATMMHLAIGLSLGLNEFAFAMLAMNLAFVPGTWLRGAFARGATDQVVYDGACPRCRASIALVKASDPDHLFEPIDLTAVDVRKVNPSLTPVACMESMHLVTAKGKVLSGHDAVARIARRTPLFWPLAWLTYVPGVAPIGRRIYARIAASRPREGAACTDDSCALPTPPGK